MGEGGPDVAAIAQWEYDGDVPSTAELVRGLEVTFRAWQECLQRWTPEDMDYIFRGERWGEQLALISTREVRFWRGKLRTRRPNSEKTIRKQALHLLV
jgi:hypothetical protein